MIWNGILAHGILRSHYLKNYLELLQEIKIALENDPKFCNTKVILQ